MAAQDYVQLNRLAAFIAASSSNEGMIRYERPIGNYDGIFYACVHRNGSYWWERVRTVPESTAATNTIAAGAAAGNTATVALTGDDYDGTIEVVPGGAGIAAGVICTVTFGVQRPTTEYTWIMSPASAAARTLGMVVGRSTRNQGSVVISTAVALTAGQTYQWDYHSVQGTM